MTNRLQSSTTSTLNDPPSDSPSPRAICGFLRYYVDYFHLRDRRDRSWNGSFQSGAGGCVCFWLVAAFRASLRGRPN